MTNIVELQPHNEIWANQFFTLKSEFINELDSQILGVEHVGSTSIKGISAKPILDIDIVINDVSLFPKVCAKLEGVGYIYQGNQGIEGREAFRINEYENSNADKPLHHLYVCSVDSNELRRHLAFRDYLRQYPDIAKDYEFLKKTLASTANSREEYTEGKTGFVESILEKTLSTYCFPYKKYSYLK